MQRAVFLDRDGTIIVDTGFVSRAEDVTLLPGAADGLARLQALGYLLVVISNQSGVGRGYFDIDAVEAVDGEMRAQLELHGVTLATPSYYCMHAPEDSCTCRKPAPDMLLAAAAAHDIDLDASVMVGDRQSDVDAGYNAGCQAVALGFEPESGATLRVADLTELASLVGEWAHT